MTIRFCKVDPDSKIPQRQKEHDAGFDLYSARNGTLWVGGQAVIPTGVRAAIPDGYVGQVWPRSGLAVKSMLNVHAGIIDSNYRGEINVCLINHGDKPVEIKKGDRIAQLVVVPYLDAAEEVDSLEDTERGAAGFGSTGV